MFLLTVSRAAVAAETRNVPRVRCAAHTQCPQAACVRPLMVPLSSRGRNDSESPGHGQTHRPVGRAVTEPGSQVTLDPGARRHSRRNRRRDLLRVVTPRQRSLPVVVKEPASGPLRERGGGTEAGEDAVVEIDTWRVTTQDISERAHDCESIEEPESEASGQSRSPALVVPGSAVVTRDGRKLVFVVADQHALAVRVETGRELGNLIEIVDGIRPGQKVIVSPPSNLKDGDRIKIIE